MASTITKKVTIPKRKQKAATFLLEQFENLIEVAQPEELERIQKSLEPKVTSNEEIELAQKIAGSNYHPERLLELQLVNLQKAYQRRRELLQNSITSTEIVKLIGCKTRSTVKDRRIAGTLIGLKENGVYRYPLWQFDPEGENGVIDGLDRVLAVLDVSDFTKLNWFSKSHLAFDGKTPIEMLKQGAIEAVVTEAKAVGVGG